MVADPELFADDYITTLSSQVRMPLPEGREPQLPAAPEKLGWFHPLLLTQGRLCSGSGSAL